MKKHYKLRDSNMDLWEKLEKEDLFLKKNALYVPIISEIEIELFTLKH